MKVGDLVRLGDSWAKGDRSIGIIIRIYPYLNRQCCDILFADGNDGEMFRLSELEMINKN
jgi:hypothetical protein